MTSDFEEQPSSPEPPTTASILREHFEDLPLHEMIVTSRVFPLTARADLQGALQAALERHFPVTRQLGVFQRWGGHEQLSFATLCSGGEQEPVIGPLQYEEIDTGGVVPLRCLRQCLWLCSAGDGRPFALLLTPAMEFGRIKGLAVEVAVCRSNGAAGSLTGTTVLQEIEGILAEAQSYRGKVISLEKVDDYSGRCSGVKVHKLRAVDREQVILPERTLELLERNVSGFIQSRGRLKELNMSLKKGLLFHGPPGTGKTHTIHYLASRLPDHTTLLITAEQVGLLSEYIQLARFLQPAMIVLEDVDLIARSRGSMRGPCEESLLNKLLNEMDGLREDAMLLFILTTNRPEDLEEALAARPGRVDQAIEFPLPDEEGRRKLIRLYAGNLEVPEELSRFIVTKTSGGSAAFLKELMRRSAQFLVQEDSGSRTLTSAQVEAALDEMLFAGGSLNRKLLGVAVAAGE